MSDSSVRVRPASRADAPAFLELVNALADYEHLSPPDAEAQGRLAEDAFATPPRFHLLLAERHGQVVGYAVYFFTYSTFLARPSLYLEDLFVRADQRGHGAGLALLKGCSREAVSAGCGRMEWQVLSWNIPAVRFYEARGARHLGDWLPFRLDGEALQRFAASPD